MSVITTQTVNKYYNDFKSSEVTFTKEVSRALGIQNKHIYFKYKEGQRQCIIYSASMSSARIIVSLPQELEEIIHPGSKISLRFCIKDEESKEPVFFFVQSRIQEITVYNTSQKLYIMNIEYTARPPKTLIVLLGKLLQATTNSALRKEERIVLTRESVEELGIKSPNIRVAVDNIPRKAIVRDLSFSGAKIILAGNAKFLEKRNIILSIPHNKYGSINIPGKVLRCETITDRKDIVAMAVLYSADHIPVDYKIMINEYLIKSASKKKPTQPE